MAMQIMNTAALVSEFTSWFFYGKTRTGKTTAAATFPRPLFLQPASEDSIDTLAGMDVDYVIIKPERSTKTGDSSVMTVMDGVLSDLEQRYEKADKLWTFAARAREDGKVEEAAGYQEQGDALFPWMTVVVESVSHYTDMVQEELTRHAQIDMDQQKWGKLSAHMRSVHERLRNLNVHRVYISLVSEIFDRQGKLTKAEPLFPGNMSLKLPSACGGVVYFERKQGSPNDIYIAHFARTDQYSAGARYPALRDIKKQMPFNFDQIATKLGLK